MSAVNKKAMAKLWVNGVQVSKELRDTCVRRKVRITHEELRDMLLTMHGNNRLYKEIADIVVPNLDYSSDYGLSVRVRNQAIYFGYTYSEG